MCWGEKDVTLRAKADWMQPLIGGRVRAHSSKACVSDSLEEMSHGGVTTMTPWSLKLSRNAC